MPWLVFIPPTIPLTISTHLSPHPRQTPDNEPSLSRLTVLLVDLTPPHVYIHSRPTTAHHRTPHRPHRPHGYRQEDKSPRHRLSRNGTSKNPKTLQKFKPTINQNTSRPSLSSPIHDPSTFTSHPKPQGDPHKKTGSFPIRSTFASLLGKKQIQQHHVPTHKRYPAINLIALDCSLGCQTGLECQRHRLIPIGSALEELAASFWMPGHHFVQQGVCARLFQSDTAT